MIKNIPIPTKDILSHVLDDIKEPKKKEFTKIQCNKCKSTIGWTQEEVDVVYCGPCCLIFLNSRNK